MALAFIAICLYFAWKLANVLPAPRSWHMTGGGLEGSQGLPSLLQQPGLRLPGRPVSPSTVPVSTIQYLVWIHTFRFLCCWPRSPHSAVAGTASPGYPWLPLAPPPSQPGLPSTLPTIIPQPEHFIKHTRLCFHKFNTFKTSFGASTGTWI